MARIEGEIVIERPVEEVFDFVADERNEPRYNPRMLSAELVSEGSIGSGSRFRAELKTPGRTMPMIVEFTDFDRPRRLASTTHSSMMETTGALTFEPKAHGTVMRWSWDVRPRGPMRVIPAAVGLIGRRQEQRIWGNLKRLLESRDRGADSRYREESSVAVRKAHLPPRWFIKCFWHVHRRLVRASRGRRGLWRARPDKWGALRLTTTGRRSGEPRGVIIGYYEDGPNLVSMAMNGWGAAEPAWWLNLQAKPDAVVELAGGVRREVVGRAAIGLERDRLWQRWRELDKNLDGYAARRPHETAVVVFEPAHGGVSVESA